MGSIRVTKPPAILIAAAFLLMGLSIADTARANFGSIIRTYRLGTMSASYAHGVFPEDPYIYVVTATYPSRVHLDKFSNQGTLLGWVPLNFIWYGWDADAAPQGRGFVSVLDQGEAWLWIYNVATGSCENSFPVVGGPAGIPRSVAYGGGYYYVINSECKGVFARYTGTGSRISDLYISAWPDQVRYSYGLAYTNMAQSRAGDYLILNGVGNGDYNVLILIDVQQRKVIAVRNVNINAGGGGACGRSPNPAFGITYWSYIVAPTYTLAEYDIGGRFCPDIEPASLGKVKACYQ